MQFQKFQGLHSGAVTGGVLRGQNSRFQLFGDTMNMASRMESTGAKNCIHISSDTAQLLRIAGKEKWIEKRDKMIDIKGKGAQNTYWVKIKTVPKSAASETSSSAKDGQESNGIAASSLSQNPVARVNGFQTKNLSDAKIARLVDWNVAVLSQRLQAIKREHHLDSDIDSKVLEQLKLHVEGIAHMYRNNSFHNFEVSENNAQLLLSWCLQLCQTVT